MWWKLLKSSLVNHINSNISQKEVSTGGTEVQAVMKDKTKEELKNMKTEKTPIEDGGVYK